MTSGFAPLSLRWHKVPGANLPGFRAAEPSADGEWPGTSESPNATEVDRLMQAIAAGATEDELVVAAAGALTTLYHILAQLIARRQLEVSVDFDGERLAAVSWRRIARPAGKCAPSPAFAVRRLIRRSGRPRQKAGARGVRAAAQDVDSHRNATSHAAGMRRRAVHQLSSQADFSVFSAGVAATGNNPLGAF